MRATTASTKLFRRVAATALLLFCAAGAAAQSHRATAQSTWLPVWNNTSGKLEAYLVLEPADESPQVASRWRFGNNSLEATYGLQAGDSLALLCNGKAGLAGALPSLPHNCMLAALGNGLDDGGSRRATASAAFVRGSGKLGVTAGSGRDTLPTWLVPGAARTQVDVNDLTVFAQKNIRSQGYVSIAGTVAMFLVGGGILVHGVPALHHLAEAAHGIPPGWLWENLFNALAGVVAGAVVVGASMLVRRLRGKPAVAPH